MALGPDQMFVSTNETRSKLSLKPCQAAFLLISSHALLLVMLASCKHGQFVRQILRSVFCKNFLKVVQLDGNVFEAGSSGWNSPSEVAESWRSSFSGCNDARDPRELVHRIAQASFLQMSAVPNWNFNMLSKSCCSVNHPESKSKLGYSSTLSRLGCVSDLQGCLPRVEFELYMLPVQTYLKHVQVHAGRMQNTLL